VSLPLPIGTFLQATSPQMAQDMDPLRSDAMALHGRAHSFGGVTARALDLIFARHRRAHYVGEIATAGKRDAIFTIHGQTRYFSEIVRPRDCRKPSRRQANALSTRHEAERRKPAERSERSFSDVTAGTRGAIFATHDRVRSAGTVVTPCDCGKQSLKQANILNARHEAERHKPAERCGRSFSDVAAGTRGALFATHDRACSVGAVVAPRDCGMRPPKEVEACKARCEGDRRKLAGRCGVRSFDRLPVEPRTADIMQNCEAGTLAGFADRLTAVRQRLDGSR